MVVLLGELRVDRQPDDALRRILRAGQPDRELHDLVRIGPGLHVALELLRGQHLVEQCAELDLAPGAPGLDVGEHSLEIPDPDGELLHLAETLVHRFEPIAHQLERLPEALFQGALELLVHGLAHLVELALVALPEPVEPLLHRLAELADMRFVRPGQRFELAGDLPEALVLRLPDAMQRTFEPFGARALRAGDLLAQLPRIPCRVLAAGAKLLAYHRLDRLAPDARRLQGETEEKDEQHRVEGEQCRREP